MENKLYRDEHRKVIGGVCSGLADYFNVDVSIVREVFVLALILKGSGVLFYIILWAVVPKKPFVASSVDFGAIPQPQPEPIVPVKKTLSTGSLIGGLVLIMLGGFLLLDQYNIIPDFDFDKFWPLILIVIGLVLIFGFWKRKPEQQPPVTIENNDTSSTNTSSTDTSSTDNAQPL